ncbi:hypothetical protein HDU76_002893 [Blyttiomyces sp. JEL0837]|nr:hypothetical protein HDU76_002893 [Blyttiomyces sp. JEL0837]
MFGKKKVIKPFLAGDLSAVLNDHFEQRRQEGIGDGANYLEIPSLLAKARNPQVQIIKSRYEPTYVTYVYAKSMNVWGGSGTGLHGRPMDLHLDANIRQLLKVAYACYHHDQNPFAGLPAAVPSAFAERLSRRSEAGGGLVRHPTLSRESTGSRSSLADGAGDLVPYVHDAVADEVGVMAVAPHRHEGWRDFELRWEDSKVPSIYARFTVAEMIQNAYNALYQLEHPIPRIECPKDPVFPSSTDEEDLFALVDPIPDELLLSPIMNPPSAEKAPHTPPENALPDQEHDGGTVWETLIPSGPTTPHNVTILQFLSQKDEDEALFHNHYIPSTTLVECTNKSESITMDQIDNYGKDEENEGGQDGSETINKSTGISDREELASRTVEATYKTETGGRAASTVEQGASQSPNNEVSHETALSPKVQHMHELSESQGIEERVRGNGEDCADSEDELYNTMGDEVDFNLIFENEDDGQDDGGELWVNWMMGPVQVLMKGQANLPRFSRREWSTLM